MAKLKLKVVSPERTLFDDEVDEVILPTITGQIAILPHHMPLVAELAHGDIVVKQGETSHVALVYGGFVYVKDGNQVLILADSADHLHELNEVEILEAKARAEAAIKGAEGDNSLLAISQADLSRITTQLRTLTKHSTRKHHHKAEKMNK